MMPEFITCCAGSKSIEMHAKCGTECTLDQFLLTSTTKLFECKHNL